MLDYIPPLVRCNTGIGEISPGGSAVADTGEISTISGALVKQYGLSFTIRYFMHRVACEVFPDNRCIICRRFKIPNKNAEVLYNDKYGRAFYGGLMTCGLNWICPICGPKIAERRGAELVEGVNNFHGGLVMFTLTMRHQKTDLLKQNINIISNAYRLLTHGKAWQNFKTYYGLAGMVSNLEIKWGPINGWNPHKHLLGFFTYPVSEYEISEMTKSLQDRFHKAIIKYGGSGIAEIELSSKSVVTNAEIVAEYVAKWDCMPYGRNWSIEAEMTQSHKKHNGHFTYYQLLELYSITQGEQKQFYYKLLQEYQQATKGEKSLVYSRGLRQLLGLNCEQTDYEIATEKKEDARKLITISDEIWRLVCKNNQRGHVLDYASQFPADIQDYINYLVNTYGDKQSINGVVASHSGRI